MLFDRGVYDNTLDETGRDILKDLETFIEELTFQLKLVSVPAPFY